MIGPSFAALTENRAVAPSWFFGSKKKTGTSASGARPCSSQWPLWTSPWNRPAELPPWPRLRLKEQPAEHPGRRDGLSVRADDPGLHRRAAAEHDVDLPTVGAGLDVAGDKGVGVHATPAGLSLVEHPPARLLEHVVLAGAQDDQRARVGPDRELVRAVRTGPHAAAPGARRIGTVRPPPVAERRPGHGPARALLDHLAAEHRAPAQGHVDPVLERPLGPREGEIARRGIQIRLALGDRDQDRVTAARDGIGAVVSLVVGLVIVGVARATLRSGVGVDLEDRVRDGLAGVGVGDAAGQDLGRLQRRGDRFRPGGAVGVDHDPLPGVLAGHRP